jgi:hypothetical protein
MGNYTVKQPRAALRSLGAHRCIITTRSGCSSRRSSAENRYRYYGREELLRLQDTHCSIANWACRCRRFGKLLANERRDRVAILTAASVDAGPTDRKLSPTLSHDRPHDRGS